MTIFQKIKKFLEEAWQEAKKITWLDRKTLLNYTLMVLGSSVVVALILGFFDFFFFYFLNKIITK